MNNSHMISHNYSNGMSDLQAFKLICYNRERECSCVSGLKRYSWQLLLKDAIQERFRFGKKLLLRNQPSSIPYQNQKKLLHVHMLNTNKSSYGRLMNCIFSRSNNRSQTKSFEICGIDFNTRYVSTTSEDVIY